MDEKFLASKLWGEKPSISIQKIEIKHWNFKNSWNLNKNKMEERGGPNWTSFAPLFWTLLGSFKLNPFYSIIFNLAKTCKLLFVPKLGRFKEEFEGLGDGNLVPCSLPPPSSFIPTFFFLDFPLCSFDNTI